MTRLPAALAEWHSSRHPDFSKDGKTDWRLFNAVTEALKEGSYMDLLRRTQALYRLLDLACGMASPAALLLPAEPPPAGGVTDDSERGKHPPPPSGCAKFTAWSSAATGRRFGPASGTVQVGQN